MHPLTPPARPSRTGVLLWILLALAFFGGVVGSAQQGIEGVPTAVLFTTMTTNDTSAGSVDIGGGLNIGTGNVALVGTDGRINGPLSTTIIDDLAGTNLTGTAAGLTAGNVTTNANLTGPITSAGNATSIAAQTGTGTTFVVNTSPTLVTPVIGVASGTSLLLTGNLTAEDLLIEDSNASHFLTITTTSDLTAGRILALVPGDAARTITLTGDPTLTTGTMAVTGAALSQFAATTSAELLGVLSDETGTGLAVFADDPTMSAIISTGANDFTGGTLFHVSSVEAVTTTKTTVLAESGETFTNTGDADGSTITLVNDPTIGVFYTFIATAAQTVTILASAGETLESTGSTCATSITLTDGQSVVIRAATAGAGAQWHVIGGVGFTCNT